MKDLFYINALDGSGSLVIDNYKYLTDLKAAIKLAEFWQTLTGQLCEVRRMDDDLSGMVDREKIWPTKQAAIMNAIQVKTKDLIIGDVVLYGGAKETIIAIESVGPPVVVVRIDVIRNGVSTFFWSGLEAINICLARE